MSSIDTWVIVLAGGEGRRLAMVAVDPLGRSCPKQFWSFDGARTLLRATLDRARSVARPDRVLTVVTATQRDWWQTELAASLFGRAVIQRYNRGTALAILIPLLTIAREHPGANVVILPCDHHVSIERVLGTAIRDAIGQLDAVDGGPILLGFTPDHPANDLGWLLPSGVRLGSVARIDRFFEKPEPRLAAELFERGALWNGFIVAARAATLLRLFEELFPSLPREIDNALEQDRLDDVLEHLPPLDFSRHVLEQATGTLWVSPVPWCGWSDIGTPDRVAAARRGAATPVIG